MAEVFVPSENGRAWYDLEKGDKDLATVVFSEVNAIEMMQPYVLRNIRKFYETYDGHSPVAMAWSGTTPDRELYRETRALVRSACETATALISQHMPKATVMTEGADLSLIQQAVDADLFLIGAYQRAKVYEVMPQAFLDSTVTGTGTVELVPVGKGKDYRVELRRVFPAEVVVPEWQCESSPRGYTERYKVTRVSRAQLKRRYPKVDLSGLHVDDTKTKPKMGLASYHSDVVNGDFSLTQRGYAGNTSVWVIEAYHISEGLRRKVVATQGMVLEDMTWPHKHFPFIDLWWVHPGSGFYGNGITYRQWAKQERLNFLHKMVHKGQNLMVNPRIFNMPGTPPTTQAVADVGTIVPGRADPKFLEQRAFGPEIYGWIETLFRAGLEDEGISLASASNALPPGLDSAPAQQQYSFKEAQRFAPVSLRYETAIAEEFGRLLLAFYAEAASRYGRGEFPRTRVMGHGWLQMVEWPDLDLDQDEFHIRLGASSLDTLSPAGRTQEAMNMVQMGLTSAKRARMLIKHPDLEYEDRLTLSAEAYAEAFAASCMQGERPPIDPVTDLVVLREAVTAAYNKVAKLVIQNPKAKDAEIARQTLQDALLELDEEEQQQMAAQQAQQQVLDGIGQPQPDGSPPGAGDEPQLNFAPIDPNGG